jgi:hypothetical protein
MNSSWIVPLCHVLALMANVLFFVYNRGARHSSQRIEGKISLQFSALKQWISEEYVSEKVCRARMNLPPDEAVVMMAPRRIA